nr:hypothetical protein [Tanacetum cinerariifolium]
MKEKKIETPPIDQTEGRENQVKMRSHPEIQTLRKRKEPSHIVEDSGKQQDQEFITGDSDEQPTDKEVTKLSRLRNSSDLLLLILIGDVKLSLRITSLIKMEYLKCGDLSRKYSTSVTKAKAATNELKWIEDLVPELWSLVQRRTIAVTRLKIMKKYNYGHLEEIEVRRDDQ